LPDASTGAGHHEIQIASATLSTASFAQSGPPPERSTTRAPPPTNVAPTDTPAPLNKADVANGPSGKQFDPQKQCVDYGEFASELKSGRNPAGDTIVINANFLPTNQAVSAGVRTTYVDHTRYFAALGRDDGKQDIQFRQDVVTRRAIAADTLVKRRLLETDQTIVTLEIDDEDAGLWHRADLYPTPVVLPGQPRESRK
jgi:hypothetical protein